MGTLGMVHKTFEGSLFFVWFCGNERAWHTGAELAARWRFSMH